MYISEAKRLVVQSLAGLDIPVGLHRRIQRGI
jgi:hypothetical protein